VSEYSPFSFISNKRVDKTELQPDVRPIPLPDWIFGIVDLLAMVDISRRFAILVFHAVAAPAPQHGKGVSQQL
jgi:hypothetical protein